MTRMQSSYYAPGGCIPPAAKNMVVSKTVRGDILTNTLTRLTDGNGRPLNRKARRILKSKRMIK